jgi:hypothetical protein
MPASGGDAFHIWRSPDEPKKRSTSTLFVPEMPGTVAVAEYCQNTALVHGDGTDAHVE